MNEGATPERVAESWLLSNGSALGTDRPELRLRRRTDVSLAGSVLAFQQFIDGVPVEHGGARVLVRMGASSRVVFASGRLARRPKGGFPPDRIDADAAVATVRALPAYVQLTEWSAPQLVVYQDLDNLRRSDAVQAWKLTGSHADLADFEAHTFFVSAADGRVVHIRNEVYQGDEDAVFGNVSGIGSPGTGPDLFNNPRTAIPIPDLTLRNQFGSMTRTNHDGDYVLNNNGGGPTEIEAKFQGPWVTVIDTAGPVLPSLFQSVVPPGPADYLFNETPSAETVAQINAFVHVSLTHDFFKERTPGFSDLDTALVSNVNILANCNAFFTPVGVSLNFFVQGGGCVNSAFSTVIAHEYGHFVVFSLDLRQGAFGEGFGDCVSVLSYNEPVVGRDFFGPGTFVRDIVAANKRYPCFGEIHDCGQVLAGVWWDIKENLAVAFGEEAGLATAQQLFADWTQITLGGSGRNSAHPLTAAEVLMVDDDDGELSNGTPNFADICEAFVAHNIPCPGTCDEIRRFDATCTASFLAPASYVLRATVSARGAGGSGYTLILDGSDAQSISLRLFGRGSARWRDVSEGEHEVCIDGCDGFCRVVTCQPE
jgi:hypothetical protein